MSVNAAREGEIIIYDLGANNGDDLPYYLKKATKVVAVEANPSLAELIRLAHPKEIMTGKLVVENVAVTEFPEGEQLDFFIHKNNHVLSSALAPSEEEVDNFDIVSVAAMSVAELISKHGDPYFVKIDLEGYDLAILRGLLRHGSLPKFISAEGHHPAVFGVLSGIAGYQKFNIVKGHEVKQKFRDFKFSGLDGSPEIYAFPDHAAGPFGSDLPEEWLDAHEFFKVLQIEGLGWYDIHAKFDDTTSNSRFRASFFPALKTALKLSQPKAFARYRKAKSLVSRFLRTILLRKKPSPSDPDYR